MTDKAVDKAETPAPGARQPAAEDRPGSPGWVPGRPDKSIDRGRGPTCPYRLGF